MEKLSITVTREMMRHVEAEVSAGRYASTSEYIRDALRERISSDIEMEAMRNRYQQAAADHSKGQTFTHEQTFSLLNERLKSVAKDG